MIQDARRHAKVALPEARTLIASSPPLPATNKSLRSFALDALCALLYHSGLTVLGVKVRRLFGGGKTRVLCYHRVADDEWPDTLARDRFVSHLGHLRRHYQLIGIETIAERLSKGRPLPRDAVAITFDDGHADLLGVLDDLKAHSAPAAFFVLTGDLPDRGTAFFDFIRGTPLEAAQKSLASLPSQARWAEVGSTSLATGAPRLMSTDDLHTVLKAGFEVGSHTRSHPLLPALSDEHRSAEVAGSREDLSLALGSAPRFFAYPWGKHDDASREAVRSAGYEAAFTTEDRAVEASSDRMAIPRVHIAGNAPVSRLAGEASGLIEFLRRLF